MTNVDKDIKKRRRDITADKMPPISLYGCENSDKAEHRLDVICVLEKVESFLFEGRSKHSILKEIKLEYFH